MKRLTLRAGVRIVLYLAASIIVAGCSSSTSPDEASYFLTIASGNNQVGLQTQPLPEPVVVRVVDRNGSAVPDLQLSASITDGDGQILNAPERTDAAGNLEIEWQMGDELDHSLRVSISEDPTSSVTVRATANYLYQPPEAIADGWAAGTMDIIYPDRQLLLDAVDDIRSGVYPEIHSMLVVRDAHLILETYFPGHDSQGNFIDFNRSTRHEVQSASKSFRSAMVGIAIDKGFIADVNETLFSAFPTYSSMSDSAKDNITLENVLTMSSGLDWDESGAAAGGTDNNLSQMYMLPATQWAGYVLGRPLAFEPGSRFVYNTGASILLNQIVMNKSELAMDIFVRRYYSSLVESSSVPGIGYPLAASITPRDMAKLGQVYLDGGRWKNEQIVSEDWVTRSCERKFQVSTAAGYGYQWWLRTFRVGTDSYESCYAAGNGGQYIFVIKDLDLVIVFTGGNFGSSTASQVFGIIEQNIIPAIR